MLKHFFLLLTVFSLTVLMACTSDSRTNSRAYVEGIVTGPNVDFAEITISLKSEDKNIAETIPETSGRFVVSGPIFSETFSVLLNKKIKSFSASKSGCTLSADQLEILIPPGTTYLTFNEIMLE